MNASKRVQTGEKIRFFNLIKTLSYYHILIRIEAPIRRSIGFDWLSIPDEYFEFGVGLNAMIRIQESVNEKINSRSKK